MKHTRRIIFLFGILWGGAFAAVVSESSFAELGWNALSNNQASSTMCERYSVLVDNDQNWDGLYFILSLHVTFSPIASEDANLAVYWNDANQPLLSRWASQISNEWVRVVLPTEQGLEENEVTVCVSTSSSTIEAEIREDSLLGTYRMPVFSQSDFTKQVPGYRLPWNQEFPVTVTAHNSGSEGVDVNIWYRKPEVSFRHVPFVKGETNFIGRIEPGQTVSFQYIVKPVKPGLFSMPAAILQYTNIFGERERLVSNYPLIEVPEPEIKIVGIILDQASDKQRVPGKNIPLKLVLSNNGREELFNLAIALSSSASMRLSRNTFSVSSIRPGESQTLGFAATPVQAGDAEIGCRISYVGLEIEGTECDALSFVVEEERFPFEYFAGFALVVIAILLYGFYQFR